MAVYIFWILVGKFIECGIGDLFIKVSLIGSGVLIALSVNKPKLENEIIIESVTRTAILLFIIAVVQEFLI